MPSIGSSLPLHSKMSRVPMVFTDRWGEGETFDWYRRLRKSKSTILRSLQLRVDGGKPPHRFILAYLDDETVWRFDRRPESASLGTLIIETVLNGPHRYAADDYFLMTKEDLVMIMAGSVCEIEVNLPPGADLLLVLSACFAISQDHEARYYDLLIYNCYFFSWAIILLVTRHIFCFSVPSPGDIAKYIEPKQDELARSLTNEVAKFLPGIFLSVIDSIRLTIGSTFQGIMPFGNRVFRKLPMRSMHSMLLQGFNVQMRSGLKDLLYSEMRDQIALGEDDLLSYLWAMRVQINKQIEEELWVVKLADVLKPLLKGRLTTIIWDLILDMVAAVHLGDSSAPSVFEEQQKKQSPIESLIFGDAEWIYVWNEALKMGLPAARDAARGKSESLQFREPMAHQRAKVNQYTKQKNLHGEIFDIAFQAASDDSLHAAQRAAEETEGYSKNPKTAEMWMLIWEVWDRVWEVANQIVRDEVVQIVERGVEDIVDLVAGKVVTVMGKMNEQNIHILAKHLKGEKSQELLSIGDLQTHVLRSARLTDGATLRNISIVHAATERIWQKSRSTYILLE